MEDRRKKNPLSVSLPFKTIRGLRSWLRNNEHGQALLKELGEQRCEKCKTAAEQAEQRRAVLIVVHPDNFLECFAALDVDVRIVALLKTDSQRGELLAEEFMEMGLPLRFAEVFYPRNRRAAGKIESRTPEQEEQVRWQLAMIRGLRER